jgi:hypothetical protein
VAGEVEGLWTLVDEHHEPLCAAHRSQVLNPPPLLSLALIGIHTGAPRWLAHAAAGRRPAILVLRRRPRACVSV